MSRVGTPIGETPDWPEHVRPMLPGSPAMPDFPTHVRVAYGLVALLLGITSALGTSLVAVNLPAIQGELGLDPAQGVWLNCIYMMFNVSMNLLLIKFRQQFGLRVFTGSFLGAYALIAVLHLFSDTFTSALAVRAVSGVTGAALSALTVFYMMQAFPPAFRMQSLVLGIGVLQIGVPLARVISPPLMLLNDWHGVYALEAGLALACLAAVIWLRLPQGMRIQAFERIDIVSIAVLATANALIIAAIGLGPTYWWFDAPWIGYALCAAVLLIACGMLIEHHRAHPLIDTRWLWSPGFIRFAVSVMLVRVVLSEQTFGAAGLMSALGMAPEQLQTLYLVVLAATLAGLITSAAFFSQKTAIPQILLAVVLIAVGAFLDAGATVQTNPASLYLSQALLGFAAAMFMGPAILIGLGQLLQRGLGSVITFAVVFGVTQVIGGLLGASLLTTLHAARLRFHYAQLTEHLTGGDPNVIAAIQIYSASSTQIDPVMRGAEGAAALAQEVARQATVLAFNDVFIVIGWGAIVVLAVWIEFVIHLARNMPKPAAGAPAAGAV